MTLNKVTKAVELEFKEDKQCDVRKHSSCAVMKISKIKENLNTHTNKELKKSMMRSLVVAFTPFADAAICPYTVCQRRCPKF